jgi:hypothetical protein
MSVHLVNPSDNSFGTAVITPRWLFVLAAATPGSAEDPFLVDESLEQIVPETIMPRDIVGISVHSGNALRGYQSVIFVTRQNLTIHDFSFLQTQTVADLMTNSVNRQGSATIPY